MTIENACSWGKSRMTKLSRKQAEEKLSLGVQRAQPFDLPEIYSELFPDKPVATSITANEIVSLIRNGLAVEEIVDLWNVVFPKDRNVRYDEEAGSLCYDEELAEYVD